MRATDLPELRDELVAHLGKPETRTLYMELNRVAGWLSKKNRPESEVATIWRTELSAARMGELYYVSSDMTDLAEAAGKTLPPTTLLREDLPSEHGLCVYDRPIDAITGQPDGRGGEGQSAVFVIGFSWAVLPGAAVISGRPVVYVSFYTWRPANLQAAIETGELSAEEAVIMGRSTPRLQHDNEATLGLGDRLEFVDGDDESIINTFGRTVMATWLLMQQPGLATSEPYRHDKHDLARLRRRRQKPQPVSVIRLRYAPQPPADRDGESGRHYDHRWAVRGHWRKQWYPSRNDHQPIWIAPHIKGPEGAPLKTGEKVYAWVR